MAYVATNYANNASAPKDQWVCAPGSKFGPYRTVPTGDITKGSTYCGQCVSYVKVVCPTLPATGSWQKGSPVQRNTTIKDGTVIATFNDAGKYYGHAAIYVSQDDKGVLVYDQYIYGVTPKGVGPRTLKFGAALEVNNGSKFYVVE